MQKPNTVRLSELREARHRSHRTATNTEPSATREAINKLFESNLTKAGFELDKFDALLKQSAAEVRQRIATFVAESDKQAPAALATLHRTIDNFSDRVERLKTLAPPDAPAQYVYLDTATEISANISLISTQIGSKPDYSSAQFKFGDAAGGDIFVSHKEGDVSFGFLWQNPSDRDALINLDGFLVFNGDCYVQASGGLFGTGFSELRVDAKLFIHELWNNPPTSPLEQPGQSQQRLSLECHSGFLGGSKSASHSLGIGSTVQYSQLAVPSKGTVMFEVAGHVSSDISDGNATFIFAENGRQLLCPGVLIAVLS